MTMSLSRKTSREATGAPAPYPAVIVTGVGVRLPEISDPSQLTCLKGPLARRSFREPAPEADHALAAAADALAAADRPAEGRTGTVWATSTAGLAEYAETCADIPAVGPGRVSPRRTTRSALTAPVTAVSIRFGLDGPYLNLTGDRDAGANAVAEAVRMLQQRQCERVVAGGSAGMPGWRPGPADALAEGALCAVLQRAPELPGGPGDRYATLRPLARAGIREDGPGRFVRTCLERMTALPDHVVLSAPVPDTAAARALSAVCPAPRLRVEEDIGDLGAAGGMAALVTAVVLATAPKEWPRDPPDVRVLALTLGAGQAVAVEVTSRRRSPQ